MRKIKLLLIAVTVAVLTSCGNDEPIPYQPELRAVYAVLNKKTFVISSIHNDNGKELLDSLFHCAKDDTFRIKPFFDGAADLHLYITLGNDCCDMQESPVKIEPWNVRPSTKSANFGFKLPPTYRIEMIFSTKPGRKNSYTPDSTGNFTLSIADDFNFRTYYVFRKVG